jgi:hypothetical protein
MINSARVGCGDADVRSSTPYLAIRPSCWADLNQQIAPRSGWVLSAATLANHTDEVAGSGTLRGVPNGFLLGSH